jgi:hypothetical protein
MPWNYRETLQRERAKLSRDLPVLEAQVVRFGSSSSGFGYNLPGGYFYDRRSIYAAGIRSRDGKHSEDAGADSRR